MKHIRILAAAAAAAMLASCAPAAERGGSDKIQVYTSFYAMYDLTRMIAGDRADVYNICPAGTEPHDFGPTAAEMARLTEADVFIYSGMSMEPWTDSVTETLSDSGVIAAETSADVPNVTENYDPHVWLDPENAYAQMEAIADALTAADPDNGGYYAERLGECREKTEKLDGDYKAAAESFASHVIITSHEAYMNLCDAYGLIQMGINGVDNADDPTPTRMAEIEDFIETNGVGYIFTEPLSSSSIVDTIAADTGCGVLVLDPFEGSAEDKDYFTVMYENLEALKTALS